MREKSSSAHIGGSKNSPANNTVKILLYAHSQGIKAGFVCVYFFSIIPCHHTRAAIFIYKTDIRLFFVKSNASMKVPR